MGAYVYVLACVPMCVWEHMPMNVAVTVKARNIYWKEKGSVCYKRVYGMSKRKWDW